jgi:uncharacterized protein (TIGR02117 family)
MRVKRWLLLCRLAAVLATGDLVGWPAAAMAPGAGASALVYVIEGGWHTELDLPRSAVAGPLAGLVPAWARYVVLGWGARDYYMARDPGLADLLRAATPGPAVMLMAPLAVAPQGFAGAGRVWTVAVSGDGLRRLSQFLWASLAKDAAGMPRRLGAGPYPQSVFYAATGTYDLSHTCNTWTAEALRAAGVPVTVTGVVFAGQLLDQLGH